MKKFRFRLERVRNYRRSLMEEKMRELKEAMTLYEKERAILEEVKAKEHEETMLLRDMLGGTYDPAEISYSQRFLQLLHQRVREQEARVAEAESHAERKRRELVEASKESKILDRLYEKLSLIHI